MVNAQFLPNQHRILVNTPTIFLGGGWLKIFHHHHAIFLSVHRIDRIGPASVRGEGSSERSVVLEGTDGSPHLLPAEHLAELGWFLGQQKMIGGWMKWMDGWMDLLHHHCCHMVVESFFFCAVF